MPANRLSRTARAGTRAVDRARDSAQLSSARPSRKPERSTTPGRRRDRDRNTTNTTDSQPPPQMTTLTPTSEMIDERRQDALDRSRSRYDDAIEDLMTSAQRGFEQEFGRRGLDMEDFDYLLDPALEDIRRGVGRFREGDAIREREGADPIQVPASQTQSIMGQTLGVHDAADALNNLQSGGGALFQGGQSGTTDNADLSQVGTQFEPRDFDFDFDETQPASILDDYQQQRRAQYGQAIDEFAPEGFAQERVGSDFGQSDIDRLHDEAMRDAQRFVERAHARGNLTDSGLNTAMGGLRDQSEDARTQLSDVADTQRGTLRDRLANIGQEAREGASRFQLGQQFDPSSFEGRIDDRLSQGREQFGSRVRSQAPMDSLFDQGGLISQAGVGQGVQNPGRQSLVGALSERNQGRDQPRGLGNRGTF